MSNKWLLLAAGLVVGVASSALSEGVTRPNQPIPPPPAGHPDNRPPWPLETGYYWIFENSATGYPLRVSVAGTLPQFGAPNYAGPAYQVEFEKTQKDSYWGFTAEQNLAWSLGYTADGTLLSAGWYTWNYTKRKKADIIWNLHQIDPVYPPYIIIKPNPPLNQPLEYPQAYVTHLGMSYAPLANSPEGNYTYQIDTWNVSWSSKFISVPAYTGPTIMAHYDETDGSFVEDWYFAPGIGLVKIVIHHQGTIAFSPPQEYNLVSYSLIPLPIAPPTIALRDKVLFEAASRNTSFASGVTTPLTYNEWSTYYPFAAFSPAPSPSLVCLTLDQAATLPMDIDGFMDRVSRVGNCLTPFVPPPITCQLLVNNSASGAIFTADAEVPHYTILSSSSNLIAYWRGTKDGDVDIHSPVQVDYAPQGHVYTNDSPGGVFFTHPPFTASQVANHPGYTRYLDLRDASNNSVCVTNTVTIKVNPKFQPPVNQVPNVSAGPNQSITLPANATLSGTITDDSLLQPISSTWTRVSGPVAVSFLNMNSPTTTASFSQAGSYVLRLSAYDGQYTVSSTMTVSVASAPVLTPNLGVSPTTLSFTSVGSKPPSQNITVSNIGTAASNWNATSDFAWLQVAPASGGLPALIGSQLLTVSVSTASLAPGTHTGRLTFGDQSTVSRIVTVTLTITATSPVLSISTPVLHMSIVAGSTNPQFASLFVSNTGNISANWTATSDAAWLTVSPTSGGLPASIGNQLLSVRAVATGLSTGNYTGHLTFTDQTTHSVTTTVNLTITSSGTPGGTTLPMPDLSGLDGRQFITTEDIVLSYSAFALGFTWQLDPTSPVAAGRSGASRFATSGISTPVTTAAPRLSLSGLTLLSGNYRLNVQAYDASSRSPWASASISVVSADLAAVQVSPSPWRSDRHREEIAFNNLTSATTIKIFTVSGRYVATVGPGNGQAKWNLQNADGEKVASGLYLFVATDSSGRKSTGKFSVIR